MPTPTRIAIVGAGHVGAATAFRLLGAGTASEVVLIDTDRARAEGEAMDLNHAVPLMRPARVWAGDYADCAGAAVTIVTAGGGQRPGTSRLDLAGRNAAIVRDVVREAARHNPDGLVLVATNPVDVCTHVAWRESGLPRGRVLGSGTVLDTARFRHLLGEALDVDPRSVHAHVVGEHGDSEVPLWSLATIAGMRLDDYGRANGRTLGEEERARITDATRRAAYEVIERKGATYFAIAAVLQRICEAILRDERTVLTVSAPVDDYLGARDVSLGVPAVLGAGGVERLVRLEVSPAEREAFAASAATLRRSLDAAGG